MGGINQIGKEVVTFHFCLRWVHHRNKPKANNKRLFIDNPYLFLATHFMYNYTHYQAISVTNSNS